MANLWNRGKKEDEPVMPRQSTAPPSPSELSREGIPMSTLPSRVPVIGAVGLSYPRSWYRHFSQWLCKHEPSSREAAPFLHFPLECT